VPEWGTEDDTGAPRIVGLSFIDGIEGCHHGSDGVGDVVSAVGSLRGWQVCTQPDRDVAFDASQRVVRVPD
jgi:hypothetical protein